MAKGEKNKKDKRHFFKDFKAELKKVIWPTPKQVVNSTSAVITIVLLVAAIVFVLDLTFEKLNTQGIDRLRNVVGTSQNNVENTSTGNETRNNTSDETTANNTNETTDQNSVEENKITE